MPMETCFGMTVSVRVFTSLCIYFSVLLFFAQSVHLSLGACILMHLPNYLS